MATRVDALRSTLDQLALDPKAQEDRPYLISMLRRLGYSDVEISAALGGLGDAEPAPEPPAAPEAPRSRVAPADDGPRVIEVEYTGPDYAEEFDRVGPDGRPLDPQSTQFAVGEGGEAGEGEDEIFGEGELEGYEGDGEDFGDFDMSAVDAVDESAWDDDWGEGGDFGSAMEKREGEGAGEMSDAARRKLLEELGLDPDDDDVVDFGPRARPTYQKPKKGTTRLIEFEEFTPHEATSSLPAEEELPFADGTHVEPEEESSWGEDAWAPEPVEETEWPADTWQESGEDEPWPENDEGGWQPAEEGAWEENMDDLPTFEEQAAPAEPAWEEAPAQPAWEEAPAEPAWEEAAPGDDPAFTYRDYTLYTREVELSTGKTQRIYFFAKTEPKHGDPTALPDGYEVKENDQTGLPYLRRVRDEPSEPTWEPAGAAEPTWEAPAESTWEEAPAEPQWESVDETTAEPAAPAKKKRVRAVRVKAESREEAERILREQGKEVRGAVPIEFDAADDQ